MEQRVMFGDNANFLLVNKCDYVLANEKYLTKSKIVEAVRNLRDELDRFC